MKKSKTKKKSNKPRVFALLPFDAEFDDVYKLGIKAACKDAGAYCEKVDEQIFLESILERIYDQISKADIIIADMTGRNANVFYETGYAHALKKPVILLTQNVDDIPFDLKHYPHIIYSGRVAELKSELTKRLRFCMENSVNVGKATDMISYINVMTQKNENKNESNQLRKLIKMVKQVQANITSQLNSQTDDEEVIFKLRYSLFFEYVISMLAACWGNFALQGLLWHLRFEIEEVEQAERVYYWDMLNCTYHIFSRSDKKIQEMQTYIKNSYLKKREAQEILDGFRQTVKNSKTIFEKDVEAVGPLADIIEFQHKAFGGRKNDFPEAPESSMTEIDLNFIDEFDADFNN